MSKTPKRPRDMNQLAKYVVDLATMDEQERSALKDRREDELAKERFASPHKPGSRGST